MPSTEQKTTQKTTLTVGYINPHKHPINIGPIPALGGGFIQLDPGQPITTKSKVKINDPIFERYVRPGGLQKEVSPTPVPLVLCPRPRQVGQGNVGFAGTSMHGTQHPSPNAHAESGVIAFQNFDDAVKAGFIRGRGQMAPESPIKETTGLPPAELYESRQTLASTVSDRDVSHRPNLDGRPLTPTVITVPPKQPQPQQESQGVRLPPGTPKGVPMAVISPRRQELEAQRMQQEAETQALAEASESPVVGAVDEAPVVEQVAPSAAVVEEISGFKPPTDLPSPTLNQPATAEVQPTSEPPAAEEAQPPATEPGGKRRFSCPICSSEKTTYNFRSQLDDHVKRHHKDQYEVVMSLIPKTPSATAKKKSAAQKEEAH